jgi:hypothetical protein
MGQVRPLAMRIAKSGLGRSTGAVFRGWDIIRAGGGDRALLVGIRGSVNFPRLVVGLKGRKWVMRAEEVRWLWRNASYLTAIGPAWVGKSHGVSVWCEASAMLVL